ncbi:unnamed protein product [Rotaria sp. Silwood2]|nr:unnamed protein product [Rotaria sp. Silwood2]CAF3351727.1 unnamed protein product [Rotaria sp. Silwood2]CAF4248033.1 unnamed protein product [Rotaria sp. Silwood2]CAF4353153.1 unnamed protein product [Rotaria sp. Silwood2]
MGVVGLPLSVYMISQLNAKSNMYDYSSQVVNMDDQDFEKVAKNDDEATNHFNNDNDNNDNLFPRTNRCEATTITNHILQSINQSQKKHKIPTTVQKIPTHNP